MLAERADDVQAGGVLWDQPRSRFAHRRPGSCTAGRQRRALRGDCAGRRRAFIPARMRNETLKP
jgi:hypothetical protein